jgi:N-acetylneuraminic acid mutarotase
MLPASDTWTGVAPLPVGRVDHATVVVESDMYVLGGNASDDVHATASVLQFDDAQGSWSEVASMPTPRQAFASCAYKSDIYVFGGYDERGEAQASVFKYDTEANEWSTQAPMPTECVWHSASLIDGLVYIVGNGSSTRSWCDVMRFDPIANTWSALAQTRFPRDSGISFVLADCLYAAGGGNEVTSASVERYDIATNTWTAVADMLEGRHFFHAVCIESEGPTAYEDQDLLDSLIAKALIQFT